MTTEEDPGDPIIEKLLEKGIYRWSYSMRYLRPRGFSTAEVWSPDRVELREGPVNPYTYYGDSEPRIREPPYKAKLVKRFMPSLLKVGGYDHWLVRGPLWRYAINYIRETLPHPQPRKEEVLFKPPQTVETELLIIGAGISGLHAALAASKLGVKTVVVEMERWVGGRRPLYDPEDREGSNLERLAEMLEARGVKILRHTVFQGFHEDAAYGYDWLENRLVLFDYKAMIFATGFYENPPMVENIDLPGAVSAGTFLKLIKKFRLDRFRKVFLLGYEPLAQPLKKNLESMGIEYYELVFDSLDPKKDSHSYRLRLEGVDRVEKVVLWRDGGKEEYDVDLFIYAYEVTANSWVSLQTGITHVYVYELGGYIPWHDIEGRTEREDLFVAGACGGFYTTEYDVYSGFIAGYSAAEYLGYEVGDEKRRYVQEIRRMLDRDLQFDKMMGSVYRRESVIPAKTRKFYSKLEDVIICPCVDVSLEDINHSMERLGYVDIDMLKRYSGLATGRCQGKLCLSNTLKYLHEVHGGVIRNIHHRIRPPYTPHPLGIFMGGGEE